MQLLQRSRWSREESENQIWCFHYLLWHRRLKWEYEIIILLVNLQPLLLGEINFGAYFCRKYQIWAEIGTSQRCWLEMQLFLWEFQWSRPTPSAWSPCECRSMEVCICTTLCYVVKIKRKMTFSSPFWSISEAFACKAHCSRYHNPDSNNLTKIYSITTLID